MSQSEVRLNLFIRREADVRTPDGGHVLLGVRLDSGHISSEAAGAIALYHLKNRRQFKVFIWDTFSLAPLGPGRAGRPDDIHWLYSIKHSEKLMVDVQLDVVSENRVPAYTEFPDCRLVHISFHDNGYTMTIKTLKNATLQLMDEFGNTIY